jgi:hypothetical protein
MDKILEKITHLESLLENSKPMRNYEEIANLVINIRTSLINLTPIVEEPVVVEPIVEPTVEVIEEPVVEEPTTEEVVAPKKTTTRKK